MLTVAGGVKCWGENIFGQLGVTGVLCFYLDGSAIPCSPVPLDVPGLESGVAAIAAGNFHTCVLTDEGGIKCWGSNRMGQFGDGTTVSSVEPVDVPGLAAGVQAIAAGSTHTCALLENGAVKCWGGNTTYQLGAESSETCISEFTDPHVCSTTPLDVETLDGGVAGLVAGRGFTCALTETGGVTCWGNNAHGQLGDGTFANIRRTPSDVCADEQCEAPLTGASTVAAGGSHTCALMNSGDLKCWGFGAFGQVGDGDLDINDRTTPVDVCRVYDTGAMQCLETLSGAAGVTAGFVHTCALMEDGGVKCWGSATSGQLGTGDFGGSRNPLPLDVAGLGPKPPATPTLSPTATPTLSPTATPTPSPTATQTPSPTATPTPAPAGDADCSGEVTSIDAALVLQFDASLLKALPCAEAADADGDGAITSRDAALILQHSAGLLLTARGVPHARKGGSAIS
ncbi:MAG: hypothetical protein IIB22_08460 [Chloroflexi bacterium]|nr:hypothetical protein [Chloroflexota bacterium]